MPYPTLLLFTFVIALSFPSKWTFSQWGVMSASTHETPATTTCATNDPGTAHDQRATTFLPSTLTDPPIKSIIAPGLCQFSDEFTKVPLLEKFIVSPTSFVLRFGLPDSNRALGLSTCACLLASVKIEGEDEIIVRPYTPISTNAMIGSFDLLVKAYPDGKMSSYMTSLTPSTSEMSVSFKHISFNVKIQYPFGSPKFIGMIAGGTGITPMIQAIHAAIGEDHSNEGNGGTSLPKVSLLFGSRTFDDILGKEMLDAWLQSHRDRLSVTHVLSNEAEDSIAMLSDEEDSNIERGFIRRELIEKAFPSPDNGSDVKIFVCGPPAMYEALCGPRDSEEVTGILGEMGYTSEQVYKF